MKLCCFLVCLSVAEALNPWATAAPPSITYTTRFEVVYTSNRVLHARRSYQIGFFTNTWILPAAEDPEGNWGHAVSGIQVSSRLSKPSFAVGEMVVLHVLIRSVSESLKRPPARGRPEDTLLLIVTGDDNRPVREWWQPPPPNDFLGMPWHKRDGLIVEATMLQHNMQGHYIARLNETYDLTRPGRYFVSAGYSEPELDAGGRAVGRIEARSGTAMFEIVAAPGTTAGTNQPGVVRTNVPGNTGQAPSPPLASPPSATSSAFSEEAAAGGKATQGASSGGASSPMATNVTPQDGSAPSTRRNVVWSASLAGLILIGALGLLLLRRRRK